MPSNDPKPGEIWAVQGPSGNSHALLLGEGIWNVLSLANDEYTLRQVLDLQPVSPGATQPVSMHWADQFDALAKADGLDITWAGEVSRYREAGLAKAGFIRVRRKALAGSYPA